MLPKLTRMETESPAWLSNFGKSQVARRDAIWIFGWERNAIRPNCNFCLMRRRRLRPQNPTRPLSWKKSTSVSQPSRQSWNDPFDPIEICNGVREIIKREAHLLGQAVEETGGPMKDKDKVVTLIRLRDMVYFGVRPTLRQCGFGLEIVRDLAKNGLIQLRDKNFGDDPDRYVIEEILPAGLSFILQQHSLLDRPNQ